MIFSIEVRPCFRLKTVTKLMQEKMFPSWQEARGRTSFPGFTNRVISIS